MARTGKPRTIFAPCKINLFLHLTGRKKDGYHKLDSLVVFTDFGDTVSLEPANEFDFSVQGAFAKNLHNTDFSNNLVVRAAKMLSQATGNPLHLKITLTKNIPLSSGLGGGSSDAAATISGLLDYWKLPRNAPYLPVLLTSLGADVPVCMACEPMQMRGIGDILLPASTLPEIPAVIVNPLRPCPTKDVFLGRTGSSYRPEVDLPESLSDIDPLIAFLKKQHNDLEPYAKRIVPEIGNVLTALSLTQGCLLPRMSGSGASCFGLYDSEEQAKAAAAKITHENPDWWVQTCWINRAGRY